MAELLVRAWARFTALRPPPESALAAGMLPGLTPGRRCRTALARNETEASAAPTGWRNRIAGGGMGEVWQATDTVLRPRRRGQDAPQRPGRRPRLLSIPQVTTRPVAAKDHRDECCG